MNKRNVLLNLLLSGCFLLNASEPSRHVRFASASSARASASMQAPKPANSPILLWEHKHVHDQALDDYDSENDPSPSSSPFPDPMDAQQEANAQYGTSSVLGKSYVVVSPSPDEQEMTDLKHQPFKRQNIFQSPSPQSSAAASSARPVQHKRAMNEARSPHRLPSPKPTENKTYWGFTTKQIVIGSSMAALLTLICLKNNSNIQK